MIKNKINVSKGDGIIYTFVMQGFIGSVSRIRPQVICQNRTHCCYDLWADRNITALIFLKYVIFYENQAFLLYIILRAHKSKSPSGKSSYKSYLWISVAETEVLGVRTLEFQSASGYCNVLYSPG